SHMCRLLKLLPWLAVPLVPVAVVALPAGPPEPALAGKVVIEINQTPAPDDDYVTWAPTPCRARVVGAGADLAGVLVNDPVAVKDDSCGVVVFGDKDPWPARTAPAADTLKLTLPRSGAWV